MGASTSRDESLNFLTTSQKDDLNLLANLVNRKQGNIVTLTAYVLHQRLYILIGEAHNTGYSPFVPYLHILSSNCAEPIDIFIEKYKEEVRGDVPSIGVYCNVMHRADEMFTINQVQQMAESACDVMRVHAVDPMPVDAMEYLNKCRDKGVCTFEENRNYEFYLLHDLVELNEKIRKSKKLEEHRDAVIAYADFVTRQITALVHASQKLTEPSVDFLWMGYRKMLDMYAFTRMLQSDNNNVCIFYGGANHVVSMSQAFEDFAHATRVPKKYLPRIMRNKDFREEFK